MLLPRSTSPFVTGVNPPLGPTPLLTAVSGEINCSAASSEPSFAVINNFLSELISASPLPSIVRLLSSTIEPATERLLSIPTLVSADVFTLFAKLVPVSVFASAGTVTSVVPSKLTPLMFLGVENLVAVSALPVNCAPINWLAVTVLNVLLPVATVTLPCTSPIKFAVIVPAAKSPAPSRATTLPIRLFGLASTAQVFPVDPSKFVPLI